MKRSYIKKVILILLLMCPVFLFPQEVKNLDALEKRLVELRNTRPDEVIKIGDYILKHSTSDRQKSNALVFMSFAYFEKQDTHKFTELLFKSKEIAEGTKDPEIITKIYGTIAQMYLKIEFKDKAAEYIEKAISEIQKMPEGDSKHQLKGLSYIELGKINGTDKKSSEANVYFKRSLAEFNKMNENSPYFIKRSYYNMGDSFYEMNEPDSAKLYLKKALDIKQNTVVNPYILFTLSNIYSKEKQYQRAIDTLTGILDRDELNDDSLKSEMYLAILKNYNALGNTEKYNLYNEKYLALNHEIASNNLSTIKNVIKIEEKDYNKKISTANQQNDRLLVLLAIFLFTGTGVFFYVRKNKKAQKKKYEALIGQLEKGTVQQEFSTLAQPIKDARGQVISPEIEKAILEKLIKFEQSDKFTNSKLSISTVSILLKTNTTYLSQIINKYKGKNFNSYINELRINYICEKIHNNPEYLTYKISYLAEMAGFTSHSTFTTIFKSVTGMSPSTFLKEAEKNKKQN